MHISDDLSWSAHTDKVVKAALETSLLLEETEEVLHGPSHPHKFLQMHDRVIHFHHFVNLQLYTLTLLTTVCTIVIIALPVIPILDSSLCIV